MARKYVLAVQCNKCGRWRGVETDKLDKAKFKCFNCGESMQLRNRKDWNVNFKKIEQDQECSEIVKKLNGENK